MSCLVSCDLQLKKVEDASKVLHEKRVAKQLMLG